MSTNKFVENDENLSENFNVKTDKRMKHLFDNSDFNVYDKTVMNLSIGAPGPDLLQKCSEYFKLATDQRMEYESKNDHFLFQYGPVVGEYNFRKTLAKFLTDGYQSKVYSEDILLTAGATNGFHLILSTLVDLSNGIVFIDELTYMIALSTISQFTTLKVITVPLNSNGVDTNRLNELLNKYKFLSNKKLFWAIYYTIPTYHNPTGYLFSPEINKELIALSRKYDILIACDDVYNLLPYNDGNIPPKRLYAYDDPNESNYRGNVISNGSFSKILSPGVRVGWMECPPRCIRAFENSGVIKSGGAVNHYTSGIIGTLIDMGLAKKQLQFYATQYQARMLIACKLLKEMLPDGCEFREPSGGYFIWIRLPESVMASEFNEFCMKKYRVAVIAGDVFSIEKKYHNYIRISIGFQDVNVFKVAIPKVCEALNEFIRK